MRLISLPLKKVNNSAVCLDLYFQHSKHFSLSIGCHLFHESPQDAFIKENVVGNTIGRIKVASVRSLYRNFMSWPFFKSIWFCCQWHVSLKIPASRLQSVPISLWNHLLSLPLAQVETVPSPCWNFPLFGCKVSWPVLKNVSWKMSADVALRHQVLSVRFQFSFLTPDKSEINQFKLFFILLSHQTNLSRNSSFPLISLTLVAPHFLSTIHSMCCKLLIRLTSHSGAYEVIEIMNVFCAPHKKGRWWARVFALLSRTHHSHSFNLSLVVLCLCPWHWSK